MSTLVLPPKAAGQANERWTPVHSVVITGGNGSGKTPLGAWIEDNNPSHDFLRVVPITSETWANYEIKGVVDADAHDIELGLQILGQGDAWIDNASVRLSKNPKYPPVRDTPRLSSLLRYAQR
jgi:hypothetical protein